jgi:hypothetical protein
MAINPLRDTNKYQTKHEAGDLRQSIQLYDVDYAIMKYLEDVVLPDLDDNGIAVKIPVVYGNSERWEGARENGVYRDIKGRVQLPMLMIRRSSVAKNDAMPMLNRHVSYQAVTKWSKENRYDRFSLLTGAQPLRKIYNITMPDYVEVTYECMAWTNFTEQLNKIVESLTWASDEYWGDLKKFKFMTTVEDYNITNELSDGAERINRVEFNLNVKAYLLPEKFDGESPVKKSYNIRKVVISTETDLTSGTGRYESLLMNPNSYNANKDVMDFLSLNNNITQTPVTNNTISFTGIKLIEAPGILRGTIAGTLLVNSQYYDIRAFINGVRYYQDTHFNVTYVSNILTLNFIQAAVGFPVTSTEEITITGKFINL